jgi:hypothetical protein
LYTIFVKPFFKLENLPESTFLCCPCGIRSGYLIGGVCFSVQGSDHQAIYPQSQRAVKHPGKNRAD